ncbi:MAG: hypothetical protein ACRD5L_09605 [Bryobacteraceae bacterium]
MPVEFVPCPMTFFRAGIGLTVACFFADLVALLGLVLAGAPFQVGIRFIAECFFTTRGFDTTTAGPFTVCGVRIAPELENPPIAGAVNCGAGIAFTLAG